MERIVLRDVCDIIDGPHATPTKTESGPVYLGIDAITEDGRLNEADFAHLSVEDYKKWTRRVTPTEGDIVFSYEATLGRYAVIPKGFYGCLGRRLAVIRNRSEAINTKWLYYYFRSPEWNAFIRRNTIKGSTVNRISVEDFPNYTIPAVKREQQDRIAGILGAIDKKISTNNAINDNLAQQLRLLYDYWFTQFDFPDESGKPYRSSGGQMVWSDDAKKEIPASWNSTKMSDAIEGIRTGLNPRDNFKLGSGTIKYITVKNLRSDGILDFSGCDTIDETARAIVHRRSDVCTGDILFASIAPLGRCHLVQELPQDWDINESVFSIRCNKATVTPEYLYMHLQSEAFVKESTACSTGSVFKGIRINTLLDSRVFLPPMQVIEKFSQQTKPLFSLQYKLNKEIQALTQLRDWLLPMLMNGQATVSD